MDNIREDKELQRSLSYVYGRSKLLGPRLCPRTRPPQTPRPRARATRADTLPAKQEPASSSNAGGTLHSSSGDGLAAEPAVLPVMDLEAED